MTITTVIHSDPMQIVAMFDMAIITVIHSDPMTIITVIDSDSMTIITVIQLYGDYCYDDCFVSLVTILVAFSKFLFVIQDRDSRTIRNLWA